MSSLSSYALLIGIVLLLRKAQFGIGVIALIAWPGTVLHEAAHALVGFFLAARPTSFSLLPRKTGTHTWQLGSVSFSRLRWWNAPPTALAPLMLAPLSAWLLENWAWPTLNAGAIFLGMVETLICAVILQAAWPSVTDLKAAAPGILVIGAVLVWGYWP